VPEIRQSGGQPAVFGDLTGGIPIARSGSDPMLGIERPEHTLRRLANRRNLIDEEDAVAVVDAAAYEHPTDGFPV
jgi:hypothetical protein